MLTLENLRDIRLQSGLSRKQLATITQIPDARLSLIELRQSEPWFDEAVLLARCLCLTGINPLMSGNLTADDVGIPTAADLTVWRAGVRKPLSLAVRVSRTFGLDDPYQLSVTALDRQIWSIVSTNERSPLTAAQQICPWCQADLLIGVDNPEPRHLPTCLPDNLWAPHDAEAPEPLLLPVRPPKVRNRGIVAKGLKHQRLRSGMKQVDVAAAAGVSANHYARVERCENTLTTGQADKLATLWGIDRALLYAPPPADVDQDPATVL